LTTLTPRPAAIRRAVRTVLSDPRYRGAAAVVQRSMAGHDATTTSVELLERLAVEQRPIGRDAPARLLSQEVSP
jgi:UDP:flavonoid glycosyltransferase YjiC (YdhE family)